MLEVNGTLIVLVISFLAFIWMLDMVFVTPVSKVMDARAAKVSGDLEKSKALRLEADTVLGEYEKHLLVVREKAQTTINDAVGEAQKKRNAEIGKVQEEGRKRLDQAKTALAGEKVLLIDQLVEEESKLLDIIMSKLIGGSYKSGNLDQALVKRTIEEAC